MWRIFTSTIFILSIKKFYQTKIYVVTYETGNHFTKEYNKILLQNTPRAEVALKKMIL